MAINATHRIAWDGVMQLGLYLALHGTAERCGVHRASAGA
jgi:hypothetical protein